MSTRKNIDKLYLSKFEGAEVAPPEDAWQNIASRLPEAKQKKKIVPLWFRYAGTAALLLLLVSLGMDYFSNEPNTRMVTTPVTRQDIHKEIRLSSSEFTETMLQISMTLQDIIRKNEVSSKLSSEINAGYTKLAMENPEEEASGKEFNGKGDDIVYSSGKPDPYKTGFQMDNDSVSVTNSSETLSKISSNEENSLAVAVEGSQEDAQWETQPGTSVAEVHENDGTEENAIAQRLAEDLIATKEEAEEEAGGRMSISTRVAPVFYDNMGSGGNAAASGVAGGKASGEVSISYGLNLAYQISEKLKIRSGVNKLDLSFSTPGVPMAAAMNSESLFDENDPSLMSRLVEGELKQQMNFIEVPMEVEYRLLDKRIGLNLIAGGSTLFLNGNNRSMDTGVRTTHLGQAENMEKLNFSANMGLGLDYQLAPQINLSLEPMFKYQLNSFSEDSGMRPYYMAIYSGFSFSF